VAARSTPRRFRWRTNFFDLFVDDAFFYFDAVQSRRGGRDHASCAVPQYTTNTCLITIAAFPALCFFEGILKKGDGGRIRIQMGVGRTPPPDLSSLAHAKRKEIKKVG
jgi:hypothetical protein